MVSQHEWRENCYLISQNKKQIGGSFFQIQKEIAIFGAH
jgi:hypothetical protein